MSQAVEILNFLRDGNTLTPADAATRFGCGRLAARIHDIKAMLNPDERIAVDLIEVDHGARVAQYSLVYLTPKQGSLF